jgi:cell division septum initiation protein DivIVA
MTTNIRSAVQALQAQLKHHKDSASKIERAIEQLSALADVGPPAAPPKAPPSKRRKSNAEQVAKRQPAPAKSVIRKKTNGKPTLAQALAHVLGEHRKAGRRGTSGKELFEGVQHAGFQFGGSKPENNMNYLYKTLRRSPQFKRTSNGRYVLA